jgi:DNA-binding protein YbaB
MSFDSRRFAQLVEGARQLAGAAAATVDVVERRLSGRYAAGQSDAGAVRVTTDHRARITRIEITPAGLTRTRGSELARQVVQAVTRAQEQARGEYDRALRGR